MKRLLILFFLLFSLGLQAELPPQVYQDMQNNAPELLSIKVLKVEKKSFLSSDINVTVYAKVVDVNRSKSGLQRGDEITIHYTTFTSRAFGWVGPSPIPLLKENGIYKAFLKKNEDSDIYLPDAKGKSFE